MIIFFMVFTTYSAFTAITCNVDRKENSSDCNRKNARSLERVNYYVPLALFKMWED